MRKLVSILCLIAASCLFATGCSDVLMPDVHFAFCKDGDEVRFSEYIKDFPVGEEFRAAITIKLATDDSDPNNYKVVIDIPKTEKINDMRRFRGLKPDSIEFDANEHVNHLTFTMQGYKGAENTVIQFVGTPIDIGQAILSVNIYDEDGMKLCPGFDTTLNFVKKSHYPKKRH